MTNGLQVTISGVKQFLAHENELDQDALSIINTLTQINIGLKIDYVEFTDQQAVLNWCENSQTQVLIDFYPSPLTAYKLEICIQTKAIKYVVARHPEIKTHSMIHAYASHEVQSKALLAVASSLGIARGNLCHSINFGTAILGAELFGGFNKFALPDSISAPNVLNFTKRSLKASGESVGIFLLESNLVCKNLLKSLNTAKIDGTGYAYLTTQACGLNFETGLGKDGLIYLAENGTEKASTLKEWIAFKIITISELISYGDNLTIKAVIENKFSALNIINTQTSKRVVVGSNSGFIVDKILVFPGKSLVLKPNAKLPIKVTINSGSTGSDGKFNPLINTLFRGAYFAADYINNDPDILPRFSIVLDSVSFGFGRFIPEFAQKQIRANLNKFGVAFISTIDPSITYGTLQVFKAFNITIPVVGWSAASVLKDIEMFPKLSLISPMFEEIFGIPFKLFSYLGWTRTAVMISGAGQDDIYLNSVINAISASNIEIANDEEFRKWPYPVTDKSQLQPYLDELIKKKIRVLAMSGADIWMFIELILDNGYKPGDFNLIAASWARSEVIQALSSNSTRNLEIYSGTIMSKGLQYYGSFGEKLKSVYVKTIGAQPGSNDCDLFETVHVIAAAIDRMVRRGEDYEDHDLLYSFIRSTLTIGCGGLIRFPSDSTARSSDGFELVNLVVNADRSYNINRVAYYFPLTLQLWRFESPIIWGSNSTKIPPDTFTEDFECPFDPDLLEDFPKGKVLSYSVCICVLVLMALISYKIFKRFWLISLEPLTVRAEISVADTFVLFTIAIEFFQYISMGPDYIDFRGTMKTISSATSLDLNKIIDLKDGIFYKVLEVVLSACLLWVALLLAVFFRISKRCERIFLVNRIEELSDIALPFLGNACFLPLIATLLNVFMCNKALGNTFSESILDVDCFQECWGSTHTLYACLSAVAFILYTPLAILLRPAWQETQPSLHIKTLPLYLIVKTVIQISIVVLRMTLKQEDEFAHSLVFLAVMLGVLLSSIKIKPYNYSR